MALYFLRSFFVLTINNAFSRDLYESALADDGDDAEDVTLTQVAPLRHGAL